MEEEDVLISLSNGLREFLKLVPNLHSLRDSVETISVANCVYAKVLNMSTSTGMFTVYEPISGLMIIYHLSIMGNLLSPRIKLCEIVMFVSLWPACIGFCPN